MTLRAPEGDEQGGRTMRRLAARLAALGRAKDRPTQRPAGLAYSIDEAPPQGQQLALALQQVAVQSSYFLLPVLVATAFGLNPIDATMFVCLTIAVAGITTLLQTLTRGPIGSGYGLPSIPAPVFMTVFLMVASLEGNIAVASSLAFAAGCIGLVMSYALPRLQTLVPTEIAGVVVLLIGLGLLPRVLTTLGEGPDMAVSHAVAAGTLMIMIAVSLLRSRFARFGVLLGAIPGVAAAIALGLTPPEPGELLRAVPWFALPVPQTPPAGAFDAMLLPAFVLALLGSFASWTGELVTLQKAADTNWRRPDEAPIRRGFAAQSLGVALAGALGGMPPSTSSASVGLAIATRTLSRSVAVSGGCLMLLLACSPKIVALVVLLPNPVKAAMLCYVCCFMVAAGCRLITARMLDERRTFTVGLGVAVGVGALIAPDFYARVLPGALGSAVPAGASLAVLLNLLTLPMVTRRASFVVETGSDMSRDIAARCDALGGSWGARRETIAVIQNALIEVGEILADRGETCFNVSIYYGDARIVVTLIHVGDPLPPPAARPALDDLDGPVEAREAFAVWLATRGADALELRNGSGGCRELLLEFAD